MMAYTFEESKVLMVIGRPPPPPPPNKKRNNNKGKRLPSFIDSKCAVAPFFEFQWQTEDDTGRLQLQEGSIFEKQVKGQVG